MIALDTDVLLRYVLCDDSAQQAEAAHLLEQVLSETRPGFVSLLVVAEFAWALQRSYGQPRAAVHGLLIGLMAVRQLHFEQSDVLARALGLYEQGLDLPDALIVGVSQKHGCTAVSSFDQRLTRHPGVCRPSAVEIL